MSEAAVATRDLHGPDFVGPTRPVDLTARPGPRARIEFRARPVSARGMAKPGPARPGPVRSGPTKAVSMGFLETIQFN